MEDIGKFIKDQLSVWPLAASNFRALKSMKVRTVNVGGLQTKLQFNPCRITSSTAKVDKETLAKRPCFLCVANRPPEQFHLKFEGRKGRRYNIQVNPYPIFPGHLVIARDTHVPQAIWHHLPDMLDFAAMYRDYTVYYNGPMAGASAPDHLHFQAVPRGVLPLEKAVDAYLDSYIQPLSSVKDATLYHFHRFTRGVYCIKATTTKSLAKIFYQFLDCCPVMDEGLEPRFNLYAWYKDATNEYRAMVVLRTALRSHHFYTDGPDHLTIGPGAAEMAGVFVAPCEEDFHKATVPQLTEMLAEVSVSEEDEAMIDARLTRTQPTIEVGIVSAQQIEFEIISDGAGPQRVSVEDGRINYNGTLFDELYFDSVTPSTLFAEPSFIIRDVTIGIDFHWQRRQDQKFAGSLKFIAEGDRVVAVNRIGLEDYLLSVISSEMRAGAPLELLKAHAVISRSWALARMNDRKHPEQAESVVPHLNYDVCADDHCQRYQGLTMAVGENVRRAIDQTWGRVLRYGGRICDTRYSKCCGGLTEIFSTCWEDRDYPYLQSVPCPYCDCHDKELLSTVLNDYDLETADFHDWEQRYTREELSNLVKERTGVDFGLIESLEPVERGPSGRIKYLRFNGTKASQVIGKELAIRRALSTSHLKSSNFEVSVDGDTFILRGKGWGHGVGLCQIGAAVMASEGKSYIEILQHYYAGAVVETQ
jgi:SpoIID/LytB domain protein